MNLLFINNLYRDMCTWYTHFHVSEYTFMFDKDSE